MLLASIPKHDPSLAHTQTQFTKHPQHHTPTPSHPPPRAPTYSKTTAHIHLGLSSMRSLFRRMPSGIAFRVSSSKDCMRGEGGRTLSSVCNAKRQPDDARTEPSQPVPAGPYLQAKGLEHLFNVLGPRTNVTRHELVSGREDPRDLLQLHQSRRPPRPARSRPPPAAAAPGEGPSRYCHNTTPQRHRIYVGLHAYARTSLAATRSSAWRELDEPGYPGNGNRSRGLPNRFQPEQIRKFAAIKYTYPQRKRIKLWK